jgi:glycosyltransferase involved in cell wall biosynthesis
VVHFIGTGWDFAGFAFLRAARESGALFTVLPAVHPDSWGDDVIDLRFYKQTDAVFCLSEHERRHLAALGVPESKLVRTVLPPMCRTDGDRDKFRTLHNLGERPVILFMGRRDEGKGYPAVLRAWVEVLRQIPSAVLCLAGPRGSEFAHLLTELPADSYRDLGVPGEMEKADALAGCDVFCLPSAHESFGIVYLEAWVYGKPAVCGTAPASRELVEHQRTGLHLSQDPEELAVALSSLLTKPALAHALGAAGLAEQGQRFTMNAMIDDHLRTWRSRSAS